MHCHNCRTRRPVFTSTLCKAAMSRLLASWAAIAQPCAAGAGAVERCESCGDGAQEARWVCAPLIVHSTGASTDGIPRTAGCRCFTDAPLLTVEVGHEAPSRHRPSRPPLQRR